MAAVSLLAGCVGTSSGGTSIGRDGADGEDGVGAAGGNHVVEGGDGAHGEDGAHGRDGADGEDGADTGSYSDHSDGDAVTGSGRLISRRISVTGLTKLDVGANFDVRVTIGEPEQAIVRMDDNLADLVEAKVVGDELHLGLKPGARVRNASLSAEVTVASLDRVTAGGVSHIRFGTEVAAEQLQLDASGASRVSGVVRAAQALASASGASTLELSGTIGHLELSGAGTSGFRFSELTVRDLDAELSGASCATVVVSGTLTARASGVSALRYSGTPRINRDETSGLSSITPDTLADDRCGG